MSDTSIRTSPPAGLTSAEAADRLAKFGLNEPVVSRRYSGTRDFFAALASPLVLILLVAAAISIFVGQRVDATIIIAMVLIGVIVNFAQSHRSQVAAMKLRDQVSPTASVLRDGEWRELSRKEVVLGDVIRLSAGDLVPADGQILTARDLHAQEAALTGESLPAEKIPSPGATGNVFLGTSIVSGMATAEVTATGPNTAFGGIAARLADRHPETEFERGLRKFSYLILRTTIFLVLFIVVVRIGLHQDAFQSLLFAVALAVGLTPEFLPMITSITLAKGALRMAESKVIVRHLASIQDLGAMDVLCSDKTGTLTSGNVVFESSLSPSGDPSDRAFSLAYWNSKLRQVFGVRWITPFSSTRSPPASGTDSTRLHSTFKDGDSQSLSNLTLSGSLLRKAHPKVFFRFAPRLKAIPQLSPPTSSTKL